METIVHTSKILAYREILNFNMNDAIDWAADMLSLGYESPSLLMLAGISKPANFYETESYLISTLKELSIEIPNKEIAIRNYCKYIIFKIANSEDVKENLYQLYTIARTLSDDKKISDFYLLYWAWDDFDFGNIFSHYWDGATKENIEEITVNTANKWLEHN